MLNEGDIAPDFTTTDQSGNQVKLSDFRGRRVVLYFYPKDDTPGCTKQACSLRDSYAIPTTLSRKRT
ncbi:MAG TPA: redoxin domain-containing protein [Pyrinomonadaceae bacterium]|nr:redoxin domain-containing protein [Pyrinomonadaceae bacterium]